MGEFMKFEMLADSIKEINVKAGNIAKCAVNQLMTLRNWAIGYYIVEYEQGGSDRASYGTRLLKNLEEQISEKGMNSTLFKWCRQFYLLYPQIGAAVSHQFGLPYFEKSATASHQFETKPELLLQETMGHPDSTMLTIKDPFTFEFLGLNARDAVSESDLEQALMDHLQEFMLELGQGFCFEARQKRIIIDDKYYFVDLVFYNRLLHCNVIIELKNDEFKHEDLGQLNAYVGYYKKNG